MLDEVVPSSTRQSEFLECIVSADLALSRSSVCTTFSYFPREFRAAKFTSSLCVEHLLSVFPSPLGNSERSIQQRSKLIHLEHVSSLWNLGWLPVLLNSPTFVVTLFRNSWKTIPSSRAQTVCLRVYRRSDYCFGSSSVPSVQNFASGSDIPGR